MTKRILITALMTTALTHMAFAANVPDGTKLADEQVFTYRMLDETSSFDPQVVEDHDGSEIVRDLFEGLYNQDPDGNNVPGVALSHDVSDDLMTYTFHLRDNAKWSDGQPVTAGDFVYGWQRAVDPVLASPYAWYMELMSIENASEIIKGEKPITDLGVSAPDEHTLVVKLSQPLPYFAKMVAHATTFPAPKWAIEAHGAEWTKPGNLVSNGAYVLTEHVAKERSVRERNVNYWDNEHTIIDKVVTQVVGDDVQALTRYKADEFDMIEPIPAGQYPALKAEFGDEALANPTLCNYYINFNLSESGPEAFKDVRVRQALAFALDRDVIVENVLQGGQFPAYNFTPAATNGFVMPQVAYSKMTQEERDVIAKGLLEDAGYGADNPLKISYLYNTSDAHEQIAVITSQMWKQKLGVEVTLENQEWKVFLETRGAQNFDLARGAWCGDYNEASTFLDLVTTDSGYNDAKYSNPRVDELMKEAKTSKDPNPLYTEVEQILAEDMPVIPLYHYSANRMLKSDIKGWPYQNVQEIWYSKDLYKVAE